MCKQIIIRNCKTTPILTSPSSPTIPLALPPLPLLLLLLISSKLPLPKCSDTGHIYMTCSWQVIVFPILVSPLCMERIFWTCRVYSAWELLHQNGGSERPAAWQGQSPNLPERHTLHWNLGDWTNRATHRKNKQNRSYTDTGILQKIDTGSE